jgi:hypothetical protein
MAGGGALVAVIAAAQAQRVREVMDAFRLADATAPDRAQTLDALGLAQAGDVEQLARQGVLVAGPRRGSWYLSEAAVVARRRAGSRPTRAMLIVLVLLLALGAVLVGVLVAGPNR